jgi:ribose/xylose/arabinose/galactoside ABC-type transport system permease subunit
MAPRADLAPRGATQTALRRDAALRAARSAGIWGLLVASTVLAALLVPGFATPTNLGNVVTQSAALGFVALGQTFVIAAGMIDLSVGQLLGLSVVLSCALTDGRGDLLLPVALGVLALGALVGSVHGWLVDKLAIEPLILTFGSLSVLQGAIFTYTDRSVGRAPDALRWIANERLLGWPAAGLLLVLAAFGAHALLRRTRFGLRLLATGDDGESARRAGVPVARIRWGAFVLSGLGAAAGGLLVAGRLGTGYPNAGQGFELDAIVAAVLGGTSLAGGRASIVGTIGAVLVLGVIANVLNLLEVSAFVQTLAKGLIVVAAILATRTPSADARGPAAAHAPIADG